MLQNSMETDIWPYLNRYCYSQYHNIFIFLESKVIEPNITTDEVLAAVMEGKLDVNDNNTKSISRKIWFIMFFMIALVKSFDSVLSCTMSFINSSFNWYE